nr:hypothetical protein [Roseisalinus antarcticus]
MTIEKSIPGNIFQGHRSGGLKYFIVTVRYLRIVLLIVPLQGFPGKMLGTRRSMVDACLLRHYSRYCLLDHIIPAQKNPFRILERCCKKGPESLGAFSMRRKALVNIPSLIRHYLYRSDAVGRAPLAFNTWNSPQPVH